MTAGDRPPLREEELFLQGAEVHAQVHRRRRIGRLWQYIFLTATVFAVIILSILLLKIINDSAGLVVEESEVPEEELVFGYIESRVLAAPNIVLAGEDDLALAQGVAEDPNGLGFVPWVAYQANADNLSLVAFNGTLPDAESVAAGTYEAARPLFVYSAASVLRAKPQVQAFLVYYVTHVAEVAEELGYLPVAAETLTTETQALASALGVGSLGDINPADYEGDIKIAGSSSVFPLTRAIADRFIAEGFRGDLQIESTGTTAGFSAFCIDDDPNLDIVNASRPVLATENAACRANHRDLQEILVGQDALAIIVNSQNDFVTDVNREQLVALLATADTWAAVDARWPAAAIARYMPSASSGTMDFLVAEAFSGQSLAEQPYDSLVQLYAANVTAGRCRAVEYEQRFYADRLVCDNEERYQAACSGDRPPASCSLDPRDSASVVQLIQGDVIKPEVQKSWDLITSLVNRNAILEEAARDYPHARVYFKRWLTAGFLTSPQSSYPELAGIRTAILGTLWVVGIAVLVSFPLGVGAAVYLEEYADKKNRLNQIIQTNINNLAGVPSIIYGLLGLAVFVRMLEPLTSGAFFGAVGAGVTANGRTVLSAGLTLALLGLPVIIISAQEAIRAVPISLRQASFGLGATRWQTVWNHVLPNAIAGILTGVILSMSRIIGETAPLVVVGASTYITIDPSGPFSKFTTLPSQIYQWTARPQDTFRDISAAAIIALLVLLFLLNATAIYLRNRYSRRTG